MVNEVDSFSKEDNSFETEEFINEIIMEFDFNTINLGNIEFSDENIKSIDFDAFKGINSLEGISFHDNRIKELNPNIFRLDVIQNDFKTIGSGTYNGFSNLRFF